MLLKLFTWWNGNTLGAAYDIKRRSDHIGTDDFGNKYYEERKPSRDGKKRRFVMYNGLAEPSKVPPDWHGWLHHTFEAPPTEEPLERQSWETDHSPNMTGTPHAIKPKGAISGDGKRQSTSSDYEAWTPDA